MENLYKYIVENINTGKIDKQAAVEILTMLKSYENKPGEEMAIIGMSAELPMCENIDEFWGNVSSGVDFIGNFPDSRKKDIDNYLSSIGSLSEDVKYCEGAYLKNIDYFDYDFFKISPKEASLMDPNQRLFLETAFKAIEDAGYGGKRFVGSNTGVFVGYSSNLRDSYGRIIYDNGMQEATSIVGNLTAIIPSRISFMLDLKGPSLVVDTACSSSLVSVALACQSIRSGQCEMALAGGVKINLVPLDKENEKIGMESSDGRTRAFDDNSDGAGIGEGVGVVVIKSLKQALKDGDNIHAIIKGFAVNQDGNCMGITAPNPAAQTEVLLQAWKDAKINPETITYIEAHGTGTNLGDPIEIKGIQNAFKKHTTKPQFCGVSSLKTNIGHLYEAAGIANLIKAVMALKNKTIPASIYFNKPNSTIDFANSPLYINTVPRKWDSNEKRRCGVSSFGISGTNCHLVLEESPEILEKDSSVDKGAYVFTISAKNIDALKSLLKEYKKYYINMGDSNIADLCNTSTTGRGHYNHRIAFIVKNSKELQKMIQEIDIEDITTNKGSRYYGYHRVVSKERIDIGEDCIREEDINKLTLEANKIIQQIEDWDYREVEALEKLSCLYIQGADINWSRVFLGQETKKVSLPTYCFVESRCWIDLPEFTYKSDEGMKSDLYFDMKWIKEELDSNDHSIEGNVMIFKDGRGITGNIITKLRTEDRNVIEVAYGDRFEELNEFSLVVGNDETSYEKLMKYIDKFDIKHILHLLTVRDTIDDCRVVLEDTQNKGLYSLYYLTRSLIKCGISSDIDIHLISEVAMEVTGHEASIKPENVTMYGLGKVISLEYPNLKCRSIDLDSNSMTDETILNEIKNTSNDYLVAYRDGKRYVEVFTEVDVNLIENRNFDIKDTGVYVITGGTGGIGLEIAKYLATKVRVNLALINRSGMPSRNSWDEILQKNEDMKMCHKISSILSIEENGSKVTCYKADVADELEMETILHKLRDQFGKVNGVIHAAGVPGDGYIIRKDKAIFDNVIRPKVKGTMVIDRLTAADELDFFVIFSSGISIIGEVGQGDYVAANAFLDSYSAYRNKMGRPTLTIDWVSWKSAGMSVDYGFNVDLIFKAIPTAQAINAFDNVLKKAMKRILIGELNQKSQYLSMLENISFRLSPKTKEILENSKQFVKSQRDINKIKVSTSSKEGVKLLGKESEEFTDIEKKIAAIYKEVLGFTQINIYDSFFELGGDSVMLNKMHAKIDEEFPGKVKVSDLFAHTSISKLGQFIAESDSDQNKLKVLYPSNKEDDDIAIIGMAVEMPLAQNIDEYWKTIKTGIEHIRSFPEARKADINDFISYAEGIEADQIKYIDGGFLDNIDCFDYKFFKITPTEAKYTDPYQRLLMKTIWKAIEDAGYGGGKLAGSNTGVYLGFASSFKDSYQRMIYESNPEMLPISAIGNITAMMPSRISYILDLKGPTMVIDTACSSTLVAIHNACRAIKNGDCETAIVSGVRICLMPLDREYMKIGIESSNGRTMTFDNLADGSGIGEGSSAVLLKPLSQAIKDGDNIYAVVKGSAINQDGASMGITAPNPDAQEKVVLRAWEDAGVSPEELAFIEAHGTGTLLGDPIEIDALQNAFKRYTDKKQFCAITAVKSNLGHLFEGAGLASLIKASLALKHREIPPTLNFNCPNRKIQFEESPMYVNTKLRKWEDDDGTMKCGVSSFGFSGTNCHIVLEEAPSLNRQNETFKVPKVLTISAKSEKSLKEMMINYREFFASKTNLNMEDVCFTSNTGRDHFNYRLAIIINSIDEISKVFEGINIEDEMTYKGQGVYYGYYHEVSEGNQPIDIGAKSPKLNQELNSQAKTITENISTETDINVDMLEELCKLYIQGAQINWEALYNIEGVRKVSLPTYEFEKNRCWIDQFHGSKSSKVEEVDKFFTMGWQIEKLKSSHAQETTGAVLIFKDQNGLGARLVETYKQKQKSVYEIELGASFQKLDTGKYVISGTEEDYFKLMKELTDQPITQIVHMFTLDNQQEVDSMEELEESLKRGVYSLSYLTRAIVSNGIEQDIDVVLISSYVSEINGFEEKIIPENVTLFGFGKVVRKEHPNMMCRCLDIDEGTSAEDILEELESSVEWYNVAYRRGVRYTEVFTELPLDTYDEREIQIKSEGVYVITGGMGGIGLEVAKYLASVNSINLAFINRSKFPEKHDWNKIEEQGKEAATISKIKELRRIQTTGSTVHCYSADVSDEVAIGSILDELRSKFGKINGVVHGAGVGGAEAIVSRSWVDFNKVFRPKVQGTWVLNKHTVDDHLDFFIMFSSIATMFSMAGQSDYIAANAYLDSFTSYRNKKGMCTITINWSTWKETGMSVHQNFNIDTLFKAILTKEAIKGLDKVLKREVPRSLIGEINYESKIIYLLDKYATKLSPKIQFKLNQITGSNSKKVRKSAKNTKTSEVVLVGKQDSEYLETEKMIAGICNEMLGFEEINIYDNFFELGADSILLTRMHKKLDEVYPGVVAVTDIFEYTSIYKLTEYIESKQQASATNEPEENNKEKDIDDDELRNVFDNITNEDMSVEDAFNILKDL